MQTIGLATEPTGLESEYQILEALHESPEMRIYLARHLRLNRDVAITIVGPVGASGTRALARYEADVERLKTLRHPSVIPVIEARRLHDDRLAVVRARVRGSSLTQLVSAMGPVPQQRVAAILEQVRTALDWARGNILADRRITQDALMFQQGSGRVLISFDFASAAHDESDEPIDDAREDARTIGALAWEMLTGRRLAGVNPNVLSALRPNLSPAIVTETIALLQGRCAEPIRNAESYVALLAAAESAAPPVPVAPRRLTPIIRVATIHPEPASMAPTTRVSAAVAAPVRAPTSQSRRHVGLMPRRSAWPMHMRVAAGLAIAVTTAVMSILYQHRLHALAAARPAADAAVEAPAGQTASQSAVPVPGPPRSTRPTATKKRTT